MWYISGNILLMDIAFLGVKRKEHLWKCIDSIGFGVFELTIKE